MIVHASLFDVFTLGLLTIDEGLGELVYPDDAQLVYVLMFAVLEIQQRKLHTA